MAQKRFSGRWMMLGFLAIPAGVFLWCWLPRPSNVALRNSKRIQAAQDAKALSRALKGYHTEYGKLPEVGSLYLVMDSREAGQLLEVLLANETGPSRGNPRMITFLDIRMNKKRAKGGFIVRASRPAEIDGCFDPWGRPFEMILRSQAGRLEFPYDGALVRLPGEVAAVISRGPDGERGTGDDVKSWE